MRKTLIVLTFLVFYPFLAAQQTLNNDSIEKLVKAGLSEDLIVSTVNASPGTYDTSADGLIALKKAGASDKVISAVLMKSSGATPPASAPTTVQPAPTPAVSAVPAEVDSVGVYCKTSAGGWQEVVAEVVNFKTGGALKSIASVGIVKGDLNGHIGGRASKLGLKSPAEFIIDVPEGRSPGEYQLLRLRVNSDNREFRSVTGGVVHVQGGAIRDDVSFTPKKIAPHIYQITLAADIGSGEFGFLPPLDVVSQKNMASSGKIYTFSIVE